jgi:hypothetical protein
MDVPCDDFCEFCAACDEIIGGTGTDSGGGFAEAVFFKGIINGVWHLGHLT